LSKFAELKKQPHLFYAIENKELRSLKDLSLEYKKSSISKERFIDYSKIYQDLRRNRKSTTKLL
jgi:hypothetical protein